MSKQISFKGGHMPEPLADLERKRDVLYGRLRSLGDFRRGSITLNYRKCGKPNCVCAQQGHPGHGPQFLWSTTIKGKSYAKSIKPGPEMQKYEEEIARYQTFLRLCDEILQVNEQICDARPVGEIGDEKELEELKKKLLKKYKGKYRKK
jgi:Family of unknown function (DUF6788)